MLDVLQDFCRQKVIDDFDLREDADGDRILVSIWMDGSSYNDLQVQQVRQKVTERAREAGKPVLVVIAAILDRVLVASGADRSLHHQRIRKA